MQHTFSKYIVSNPEILGGMPVVSGTRIPAERIHYLLREGRSIEAIEKEYSWVEKRKIRRVIGHLMKAGLDAFEKTHQAQASI